MSSDPVVMTRVRRRPVVALRALRGLAGRADALVTRERVRNYSWIFLVLGSAVLVLNVALGQYPFTKSGEVAFPDFVAHWTGARLAVEDQVAALYDPVRQGQLQREELPGSTGLSWFVSPPVAVGLYLPFGWLSYGASGLVWTVLSAGLLALALLLAKPLLGTAQRSDHLLLVLVVVASTPVLELLGAGQDSAVALLLLVLGLRLLLADRNVLAGAVLALGVFKPQLFVLVPLALLVQQRHRALASYAGVSLGLVALSVHLLGFRSWVAWLEAISSPLYSEAVQVDQTWKMQSISSLLTAFGVPESAAYVVLAVGAVALFLRARQVRADTQHVWSLTLLTTVVFSPHVMLYDLVVLVPALAWFYCRRNVRAARLLGVAVLILLASIAVRHLVSGLGSLALVGAPWSALPLLGLWIVAMRAGGTDPGEGTAIGRAGRTGHEPDEAVERPGNRGALA